MPENKAILKEAKKYSPGANWINFTPIAGAWKILTISWTLVKHKSVIKPRLVIQKTTL